MLNIFYIPEYIIVFNIIWFLQFAKFKVIDFIILNLLNFFINKFFIKNLLILLIFVFKITFIKNYDFYINIIKYLNILLYLLLLILYFIIILFYKNLYFLYKNLFFQILLIKNCLILIFKFYYLFLINKFFIITYPDIFIIFKICIFIIYLIFNYYFNNNFLEKINFLFINLIYILDYYNTLNIFSSINNTPPVLNNILILLHVPFMIISYSILFIVSLIELIFYKINYVNSNKLKFCNKLFYKLLYISFISFSIGNILGSLWANISWGNYWSWDPKEVWSLILWLNMLLTLHLYNNTDLKFINPVLFLINLILIIFNFYFINYFYKNSLHSYN